jgi:thioredoxin reductase (NADPH)
METNIPGLFVAGTAAAGTQSNYTLFIENTHVHVGRILQVLTGRWPDRLGTIPSRQYEQPLEDIQSN